MKRAILLIRVSTVRQNAVDQTNELRQFAKRDGYKEDEIYEISNVESAVKLTDEQRQGLTEMKSMIEDSNNSIETVYIWELSRLSRKPDTLLYFRGYFEEKGVDLRFMKPLEFRLLDNNKKVNSMAKMIYSNFVTWCENEIKMRSERFERSKRGNALSGKSNGGNLRYGYKVDSNGKFEINSSEATIIQTIFEKYITGKYSILTLMRHLRDSGIVLTHSRICSILKFKGYTGEPYIEQHRGKNYYERVYPKIVSIEQYNQCAAVAINNNAYKDKKKKNNYYFASKLIKCSSCGHYLHANIHKNSRTYLCGHKTLERLHTNCKGGTSIQINAMDSIVWIFARGIEIKFIMDINTDKLKEIKDKIAELKIQNDRSEKQYEGIKDKKRVSLKKILPTYNDSAIEQLVIDATKSEWNRIQDDILNRNAEIRYNESLISEYKANDILSRIREQHLLVKELNKFSDQQKYDIVHKHIKEINITELQDAETPTKRIDITYHNENIYFLHTMYYCPKVKDKSKKLYWHERSAELANAFPLKRYYRKWEDIYLDRF
jgi:DNA invertase Pin-like site-specific DNA recombinase